MTPLLVRLCAALCLSLAAACSPLDGGHVLSHHDEREQEEEAGPRPVVSTTRITGTTFLTGIREIGMFNGAGRVTCMVIDVADSNHLIAGAETGGLWVSRNRGRTWAPVDDHLPTLSIQSITQNPLQPNTYYASTYTLMQTGPLYTSQRPDIYKSTDGGKTFSLLPASAGNFGLIVKVVCAPNNAPTLYALSDGFSNIRGLYRSQNNGATFTQVLPISGSADDVEVSASGAVLVSGGGAIYRSPNGNPGTFTTSTISGTNTFSRIDLSFCSGQPASVWGISTGGNSGVGVFRSGDGGLSWSFVQSLATGSFTRAIGVKPNDPGYLFAGSVGLYLSRNAGSSFTFYAVGGVDWWSVNFDPHNADKVFMTFDQGIVQVNLSPFNPNNNTAYIRRDSLLNNGQIYAGDYFPTGDKVACGFQDLSTYVIHGSGSYGIGAGGDGGYTFYHKQDTSVIYGSRQNGDIFKKTKAHILPLTPGFTQPVSILNNLDADKDGDVDEGASFTQPFWVNNADGEQLYYPTRRRLWRSTNGGTSWQPVSAFYDLTAPGNGETYIEGSSKANPVVYWSVKDSLWVKPSARTAAPGGELKLKMPGKVRFIRADPANDSIVYITLLAPDTGARIYRSGNIFKGGLTWTSVTGDLPGGLLVRCIEVNPQDRRQMIAGTSSGLFVSGDGGAHWAKELQVPNVSILRSAVRPSDRRIFLFTYGRGAWAASFPAASGIEKAASAGTAFPVWPNPTSGSFQLTPEADGILQIFSADGRLLRSTPVKGGQKCATDISAFPAGNYFLKILSGGRNISTARIVKE